MSAPKSKWWTRADSFARLPPWVWVDQRLTAADVRTLGYIVGRIYGDAFALSQTEIARETHVTDRGVRGQITKLVELGYLERNGLTRTGGSMRYRKGPALSALPSEIMVQNASPRNGASGGEHVGTPGTQLPPPPEPSFRGPRNGASGDPRNPASGISRSREDQDQTSEKKRVRGRSAPATRTPEGGRRSSGDPEPRTRQRPKKSKRRAQQISKAGREQQSAARWAAMGERYGAELLERVLDASTSGRGPWMGLLAPHDEAPSERVIAGLHTFLERVASGGPKPAAYAKGILADAVSTDVSQRPRIGSIATSKRLTATWTKTTDEETAEELERHRAGGYRPGQVLDA